MISLPTLPATNAENPVKSAGFAAPDGVFANILLGEAGATKGKGGKILPEGGKDLPDTLPELALQVVRKGLVREHGKPEAVKGEAGGDGEEADAEPEGTDIVAIALVVPTSLQLDPAPLAPRPPPFPAVEPEGEKVDKAPASRREMVLPLAFPGMSPAPEEAPAAVEPKPGRHIPVQAAQALIAALRQTGDTMARRVPTAEQSVAPEHAIAAAAEATPAFLQDEVRSAKALRPQARREVVLALAKDAKAPGTAEQTVARAAPSNTLAFTAAQPVVSDSAAPAQGAKAGLDGAGQNHTIRPHEFATLVDRLIEARETVRPATANLTVMHADFGKVSLNFGHDQGNLTVSLANNDPGFLPAVNAAVAADASNGDASFNGGRRDDGGQAASSRGTSDSNSATGQRGSGREGEGRHGRTDRTHSETHLAGRGERGPRDGIFA